MVFSYLSRFLIITLTLGIAHVGTLGAAALQPELTYEQPTASRTQHHGRPYAEAPIDIEDAYNPFESTLEEEEPEVIPHPSDAYAQVFESMPLKPQKQPAQPTTVKSVVTAASRFSDYFSSGKYAQAAVGTVTEKLFGKPEALDPNSNPYTTTNPYALTLKERRLLEQRFAHLEKGFFKSPFVKTLMSATRSARSTLSFLNKSGVTSGFFSLWGMAYLEETIGSFWNNPVVQGFLVCHPKIKATLTAISLARSVIKFTSALIQYQELKEILRKNPNAFSNKTMAFVEVSTQFSSLMFNGLGLYKKIADFLLGPVNHLKPGEPVPAEKSYIAWLHKNLLGKYAERLLTPLQSFLGFETFLWNKIGNYKISPATGIAWGLACAPHIKTAFDLYRAGGGLPGAALFGGTPEDPTQQEMTFEQYQAMMMQAQPA